VKWSLVWKPDFGKHERDVLKDTKPDDSECHEKCAPEQVGRQVVTTFHHQFVCDKDG
jgi:hypothetical protein